MSAYAKKLKKSKVKLEEAQAPPPEDPDAWGGGDTFDALVGAGTVAATLAGGPVTWGAGLAALGTGMAAKGASESIREGVEEGDAGKIAGGALQAGTAYSGVKGAKSAAAQQLAAKYGAVGMEGMTADEMDEYMKYEQGGREAAEAAKKKAYEDLPAARKKRTS